MRHVFLFIVIFGSFAGKGWAQNKTIVAINGAPNALLQEAVQQNVSQFLTSVNIAFRKDTAPVLNDEMAAGGADAIRLLWRNIPFFCSFTELSVDLLQTTDGFELRNIPLTLKAFDADGDRQQREGVLQLSNEGQITDMYFGIEEHQYESLLQGAQDETDLQRKQVILNFVENIRTAYNRKDLPLIEQVYSDNALIIIGRVLVEEQADAQAGVGSPRVAYIRRKKSEYLDQLRQVFESNEFINLGFEDIKIIRHPAHEAIYGVTLLQYWESSSYSDSGYLFLMVDFRAEDRPIIHVRTWQPAVEVTESEVFQLNDFWINTRSN